MEKKTKEEEEGGSIRKTREVAVAPAPALTLVAAASLPLSPSSSSSRILVLLPTISSPSPPSSGPLPLLPLLPSFPLFLSPCCCCWPLPSLAPPAAPGPIPFLPPCHPQVRRTTRSPTERESCKRLRLAPRGHEGPKMTSFGPSWLLLGPSQAV